MRRATLSAALCFITAGTVTAQTEQPVAAWLGWSSVLVAIAPDSLGVHLWVKTAGAKDARPGYFFGTFEPRKIESWISGAREFALRDLADSGAAQRSEVLRSAEGDGIYIARRKQNGVWSAERFVILESLRDSEPVRIASDAESVRDILDSLQAVARRAPFSESVAQRVFREVIATPANGPAYVGPGYPFPIFPPSERQRNPNGLVVVSFVVDEYGRVDPNTIQPFYATSPAFLEAVRTALPGMKFRPAIRLGGEVGVRVLMPFQFSIVR